MGNRSTFDRLNAGNTYREVLDSPSPRETDNRLNVDEYALTIGALAKLSSNPDVTEVNRINATTAMEKISNLNPSAHQAFMARTGTEE